MDKRYEEEKKQRVVIVFKRIKPPSERYKSSSDLQEEVKLLIN